MFKNLSRKVIILFALCCMFSLGIGVALGYGIHTKNLSATASNLSNPNISITNPSNELGPSESRQLIFDKLSLEQAQSYKNESQKLISKIEKLRELQQQLNLLSKEMEKAGSTNENQGMIIPLSLVEACATQKFIIEGEKVENGIKIASQQYASYSAQINQVGNAIGDEMQQTMILLQDYMNKYNSYLQQVNEVIEKINEQLRDLEKR